MAIAYNTSIVRDGLVLYLDAANKKSYSGTGTAWNDLRGATNTAELVNSPTFNSSNAGYFEFVTDDFARMQNDTSLDAQSPTVEVWVKTNSLTQNGFFFEKGTVNTQYSLFQEGTTLRWRMNLVSIGINTLSITSSNFLNTDSWFQIVGTYTSGDRRIYINGVQVAADTQTGTINTNSGGMSVGVYGGYAGSRGYYYNGNLSSVKVYNRALSATEIQQNFNALRGRYNV